MKSNDGVRIKQGLFWRLVYYFGIFGSVILMLGASHILIAEDPFSSVKDFLIMVFGFVFSVLLFLFSSSSLRGGKLRIEQNRFISVNWKYGFSGHDDLNGGFINHFIIEIAKIEIELKDIELVIRGPLENIQKYCDENNHIEFSKKIDLFMQKVVRFNERVFAFSVANGTIKYLFIVKKEPMIINLVAYTDRSVDKLLKAFQTKGVKVIDWNKPPDNK